MRVALIGDIHATRRLVAPWALLGKRALGLANAWLNPKRRFRLELLRHVLDRMAEIDPDHLLLTGDLTATAHPGEFDDVARVLDPYLRLLPSMMVPGNHDRYTFHAARHQVFERTFHTVLPNRYPSFRRLTEHWRLLALDASVPRVFVSRGRLGLEQIRQAVRRIELLEETDGLIVLCHYPFETPPDHRWSWQHQLFDAEPLKQALAAARCRVLFLHGHVHRPWCWRPPEPDLRHVTVINAGACALATRQRPLGQGFWQLELTDDPAGDVLAVHEEPSPAGERVTWLARSFRLGAKGPPEQVPPDVTAV
jgi:3',5'-cyclic AMP phosphodiesterase CpdA